MILMFIVYVLKGVSVYEETINYMHSTALAVIYQNRNISRPMDAQRSNDDRHLLGRRRNFYTFSALSFTALYTYACYH